MRGILACWGKSQADTKAHLRTGCCEAACCNLQQVQAADGVARMPRRPHHCFQCRHHIWEEVVSHAHATTASR